MAQPTLPDNFLAAEFDYIAGTAAQANEDRARVSSFYLVAVGSFVAAVLTSQQIGQDANVSAAFVALFALLTIAGLLTLLQLVRLRQAWFDSVNAMNHMKTFYVQAYGPEIEGAFAWRMTTLPRMYKPWSVAFLLAFQVALLSGVTLGAAVFFGGLIGGQLWWTPAIIAGGVFVLFQLWLYRRLLCRSKLAPIATKEDAPGGTPS